MPKYIDQDKLVNRLKEYCTALVKERWFDDYVHGYSAAISDIMDEPTADVQEVKHGHWVEMVRIRKGRSVRLVHWQCSLCECFLGTNTANYCPNCGAIMDEEDENNEQN